ncbi:MAG: DUF2807 domain-containing protein [Lachnospiraceae bacterium]|nr:DUF2807 domain-containing protein [Lachnospiraceae bacterium]
MKRFAMILILAGLLALTACGGRSLLTEERNGAVTVKTVEGEASSLEIKDVVLARGLSTGGPRVVLASDGGKARVELEGPSDLLENVKTVFSGKQLKITTDPVRIYRIPDDLTIRLYNYDFDTLHFAGACRVEADEGLGAPAGQESSGRKLEIHLSGASSLVASAVRAGSLAMDFSGASSFTADLIECGTWKQDASGGSAVTVGECRATGETRWYLSGASRLTAAGKGTDLFAVLSGASAVTAPDFEFNKATLTLSGAAILDCWVTQLLGGSITGASKVYYKGDPSLAAHTGSSSLLQKR